MVERERQERKWKLEKKRITREGRKGNRGAIRDRGLVIEAGRKQGCVGQMRLGREYSWWRQGRGRAPHLLLSPTNPAPPTRPLHVAVGYNGLFSAVTQALNVPDTLPGLTQGLVQARMRVPLPRPLAPHPHPKRHRPRGTGPGARASCPECRL